MEKNSQCMQLQHSQKEKKKKKSKSPIGFNKIITYQGIDACHYSIHNEDEEDLIVCMADAIINPYAMMVLYNQEAAL